MTQPESKLSSKIMKAMREQGAYVWKVHGNEFTPAGTPDVVGVYLGSFVAVETKMPGNDLSPIQRHKIHQMREAGGFVAGPCYSVRYALDMLALIDRWLVGDPVALRELYDTYGLGAERT